MGVAVKQVSHKNVLLLGFLLLAEILVSLAQLGSYLSHTQRVFSHCMPA